MRKVLFVWFAALALVFTACSSDKPGDDDDNGGGNGNGNSNSMGPNGSRIQYDFSRYWLEIDVADPEVVKEIKEIFSRVIISDNRNNPTEGYILFFPGNFYLEASREFLEGCIDICYKTGEPASTQGDYMVSNDSILCYRYGNSDELTRDSWYRYYLKKGNLIFYKRDATDNYKERFPNGGVKKVIFHAEYKKR